MLKGISPILSPELLKTIAAVSYTHLDVYKRQNPPCWTFRMKAAA